DWRPGRADLAPSRFGLALGPARILVFGGQEASSPEWLAAALKGRTDPVYLAFGRVPGPAAQDLVRLAKAPVVLAPGDRVGEPRRIGEARWLEVPEFDRDFAHCLVLRHEAGELTVRKKGSRGPGDEEWVLVRSLQGPGDRFETIRRSELPSHPLVAGSLERALKAAEAPK
ncbi:MAG: hypothetical protein KDB53_00585, partial [Planctomycetes bacterium]|nr:hypothetical protein [Planctomycetota bacterium]